MLSRDGDFGLLFVVHFEHETGFEPGNDFLDVVNVDEIGTVGTPERVGVEGFEEFFESTVVGGAFDVSGRDGDEAAFDGSEDEIAAIDQEHALLRTNHDLRRLRIGWFGSSELGDKLLEAFGGAGLRFDFAFLRSGWRG